VHISVIIPAFNVAPFLADAILSVLDQTHTDWSLVVVDDGSTDNPTAIVARFPDDRIRFIRQKNAGVSAARNTGLHAYHGLAWLGGAGTEGRESARTSLVVSWPGPTVSWPGLARP
jgi:glycosyltransferase involved in cell wall biosynthesis